MFFFGKRIPAETQLDELAKCGIQLGCGVTIDNVILGSGSYFSRRPPNVKKLRRELEVKPYDAIMTKVQFARFAQLSKIKFGRH